MPCHWLLLLKFYVVTRHIRTCIARHHNIFGKSLEMLYSLKWLHTAAAAAAAERLIETRVRQDSNFYNHREHMLTRLALMKFRTNVHVTELSYPRTIFFWVFRISLGFMLTCVFVLSIMAGQNRDGSIAAFRLLMEPMAPVLLGLFWAVNVHQIRDFTKLHFPSLFYSLNYSKMKKKSCAIFLCYPLFQHVMPYRCLLKNQVK